MHILCTICSDLVNQAENIYVTKCGHIFHFLCLSQWIERSKSCPQCRNKVTEKCMFRLYPTIYNESSGDDAASLRQRLDDALLQLRQQKATFKDYTDKIASFQEEIKTNKVLLAECQKKLESRETAIAGMREQIQYLKEQNRAVEKLKEENEMVKKNIQTLNGLQKVLNASSEEVEKMLEGYSDVRTVATFATALKRALCEAERKKNETRDRLQMKLSTEKATVNNLNYQLAHVQGKLAAAYLEKQKLEARLERKRAGKRMRTEPGAAPAAGKTMKPESSAAPAAGMTLKPSDFIGKPAAGAALESSSAAPAAGSTTRPEPGAAPAAREPMKPEPSPSARCDTSYNSMVNKIENAESPYLRLQQSSLALSSLSLVQHQPTNALPDNALKPSEYALLKSARRAVAKKQEPGHSSKTSIFQTKKPVKIQSQETDPNLAFMDISYDGLGGHSRVETFPVPNPKPNFNSRIPKLSAKHKLKRPNPAGSQNIKHMFQKPTPEE